ncbi:hypothetical protein BDV26DRAFT_290482 [Aspergillus bertholletiae]|uniref:Uncharacterized protein n=1 Tax=Aspergillus bertholletiae TaxID=1226010 RepID=A0A5N7BFK4_9EURO|nr:hypothetical protein BDV26DRAFT_290482 [Aspergillus bertholletiae]
MTNREIDEKADQIKGEIGVDLPGIGYKSLKPFAASLSGKTYGKFSLGAGINSVSFVIFVKDNIVRAQVNEPGGGHEITLFQLRDKIRGEITWHKHAFDAVFVFDSKPKYVRFRLDGGRIPMETPMATITYNSVEDLQGNHQFHGKIDQEDFSLTLRNGTIIEGKFFEPRTSESKDISGQGDWSPPDDIGSVDDGQFGSSKVGQQEGPYDGMAWPTVGLDGK